MIHIVYNKENAVDKNIRKELLRLIEKNSKIDLNNISKMLNISEVDVANELSEMENEHIICGYLTLIDWEKTDSEKVTGLIEVKVTPQRGQGFDRIAERIYNYEEVSSVYLISGGYDLLVILEKSSLKDIAKFVADKLSTIDSVLSTATHFILKKYKDHGIIFNNQHEDERVALS